MTIRPLSRRAFAQVAAAALAGAPLAAAASTQVPATPARSGEEAEIAAKTARILALYGDRLTPAQKERLQRTVAGHVAMLGPVRAVGMTNSDPPAAVLDLVRGGQNAQ